MGHFSLLWWLSLLSRVKVHVEVKMTFLCVWERIWFITLITFKCERMELTCNWSLTWCLSNNYSPERCSLPFARLKLKPVQRMSCLLDYEGVGGLPGLEGEKINKRQSRAGLAVGGKCQAPGTGGTGGTRHSNNLGQCFLCLEQATTQVSLAGDHNFLFPLTRFASSLYKLTACY